MWNFLLGENWIMHAYIHIYTSTSLAGRAPARVFEDTESMKAWSCLFAHVSCWKMVVMFYISCWGLQFKILALSLGCLDPAAWWLPLFPLRMEVRMHFPVEVCLATLRNLLEFLLSFCYCYYYHHPHTTIVLACLDPSLIPKLAKWTPGSKYVDVRCMKADW